MTIKNLDSIIEQLTEMLMDFDRELNGYDTDVYLYYDEETETARLDTFVNVGGNSWLDDDHYTIYTDKEHFESWFDSFENEGTIADYLEIPVEQLMNEVKVYHGYDDDEMEYITYTEIREYVFSVKQYRETLWNAYDDDIEYFRSAYVEKADLIMDRFFTDIAECEHVQKYGY